MLRYLNNTPDAESNSITGYLEESNSFIKVIFTIHLMSIAFSLLTANSSDTIQKKNVGEIVNCRGVRFRVMSQDNRRRYAKAQPTLLILAPFFCA
jgi:hypothetical protein